MNTSIFIRSYKVDFKWLKYCLKSIEKHAKGFTETVIVVPAQDMKLFKSEFPSLPEGFRVEDTYEEPGVDGYMTQQLTKLNAETFYVDPPDNILFTDSDTCFTRDVTPETFFLEDKPVLLITPYEKLGDAVPWKVPTEKALGFECPYETMRRLPLIYPSFLFSQLRNYMGVKHGMTIEEYVRAVPGRAFSEFNVLGSFAYHFYPDSMFYWDTEACQNLPQTVVKQYWSWGGLTEGIKHELEGILKC